MAATVPGASGAGASGSGSDRGKKHARAAAGSAEAGHGKAAKKKKQVKAEQADDESPVAFGFPGVKKMKVEKLLQERGTMGGEGVGIAVEGSPDGRGPKKTKKLLLLQQEAAQQGMVKQEVVKRGPKQQLEQQEGQHGRAGGGVGRGVGFEPGVGPAVLSGSSSGRQHQQRICPLPRRNMAWRGTEREALRTAILAHGLARPGKVRGRIPLAVLSGCNGRCTSHCKRIIKSVNTAC